MEQLVVAFLVAWILYELRHHLAIAFPVAIVACLAALWLIGRYERRRDRRSESVPNPPEKRKTHPAPLSPAEDLLLGPIRDLYKLFPNMFGSGRSDDAAEP